MNVACFALFSNKFYTYSVLSNSLIYIHELKITRPSMNMPWGALERAQESLLQAAAS